MKHPESAWQEWGRRDPYFAVYSEERFRKRQLDDAAKEEFFRTGAKHLGAVLSTIRERLDADFRPFSALDFGCGVGRVLVPLARQCSRVVGIDISDGMLEEARRNLEARGISNVELINSNEGLSGLAGGFDLIHSVIVFQHIPVRRGMAILRTLLEHVNDRGAVFCQFVYRRSRPISPLRRSFKALAQRSVLLNSAVNILRGAPVSDPPMQVNLYNASDLLALFHESGMNDIHLSLRTEVGYSSVDFYCRKTGRAAAPAVREFERPDMDRIPAGARTRRR